MSRRLISVMKFTCPPLKPFSEVPSPKSYPIVGHTYLFFPQGKYRYERMTEAIEDLSEELGPIFTLKLGDRPMLITLNADDAQSLFRHEGSQPIRQAFPALADYRRRTFGSIGVVPGNGDEWSKFRKGVNPLLKTNITSAYKEGQTDVAKDFVRYIAKTRDDSLVLSDIYQHLMKFSIEAISLVSPGYRFRCMLDEDAEAEEISRASVTFMDGIYATLMGLPLWKFWRTSGWTKLEMSHEAIYRILNKHLETIRKQYEEDPEEVRATQPYMHAILSNEDFSWGDITMLAMEVFLGGIDATSTTLALTLLHLAKDRALQEVVRSACSHQDGSGEELLKACIKETLRLNPTAGASARVTVSTSEMGGFLIPPGTLVLAFNSAMGKKEAYFQNASAYYPQRWLRGEEGKREMIRHKFASLPFGYGPRMCPGRRIAENEIVACIKEILKSFQLENAGDDDVGMVFRMNRIPDRPINIKFVNTNH